MRPILLATAGLLAACNAESDGLDQLGNGELYYRATTADSQPLLEGRLSLMFPADSIVTGTWQIHWSPAADTTSEVGPQVGAGSLIGTRSGDTLRLELNPDYADNNVSLLGVAHGGGLRGSWTWSTLVGESAAGLFSALPD